MKKVFARFFAVIITLSLLIGTIMLFTFFQQKNTDEDISQKAAAVAPESIAADEKGTVRNDSEQSTSVKNADSGESLVPDDNSGSNDEEMRGVWIPYMSLQLSESERSEAAFREKIGKMLDTCVSHKLNTVIIHVRPFGDAVYPSKYYPWSHIISGEQGKGVDFDPLQIIIEEAHNKKIAVHAWLNPFRISTGKTPSVLSQDNPYIKWKNDKNKDNDSYAFTYEDGIYYDPAYSEVRKLIINGVREIAENYDLDGIQIDDYFYPSEEEGYDKASYEAYKKTVSKDSTPMTLSQWRKNNVNMLIAGIYRAVHRQNKHIMFGISPQCNFDNNEKLSADIKSWCEYAGYVDYICPQLYVSPTHPVFPFEQLADEWKDTVKNENVRLYFGLGLYKAGTDADNGTWQTASNNLRQEIEYLRNIGVSGFMLYSFDYLTADETQEEVTEAMALL